MTFDSQELHPAERRGFPPPGGEKLLSERLQSVYSFDRCGLYSGEADVSNFLGFHKVGSYWLLAGDVVNVATV